MLPPSVDRLFDLTVRDAAAGSLTLKIMPGVVLVLVPAVVLYQGWVAGFSAGRRMERYMRRIELTRQVLWKKGVE